MHEIILDGAEKYMATSIFSLVGKKKKAPLFISIQMLGLTYDLIISCNTISQAALYVGNVFLSYNGRANFYQPYPFMGKIPNKIMEKYCLRVIKLCPERSCG